MEEKLLKTAQSNRLKEILQIRDHYLTYKNKLHLKKFTQATQQTAQSLLNSLETWQTDQVSN